MKYHTKIPFALLGALLAIVLSGCANREAQLTGTWKLDPTTFKMPNASTGDATKDAAAKKMTETMMQNMASAINLELKEDKTFTMNMMFPMEGTWSLSGDTVQLNLVKAMGMEVDKMPGADKQKKEPMVLSISADNKALTLQDKTGKTGAMVFKKQ